jgi:hypothetical protein
MNSKNILSFYSCFMLVLQDALLLMFLHFLAIKTPLFNYLSILGHQVLFFKIFCLLACSSRFSFRAWAWSQYSWEHEHNHTVHESLSIKESTLTGKKYSGPKDKWNGILGQKLGYDRCPYLSFLCPEVLKMESLIRSDRRDFNTKSAPILT